MIKKILYFAVLICLAGTLNNVYSDIIPLKKPVLSKAETQEKLLIDILKPLPKPIKETEIEKVEEKIIVKKKIKNNLILPKKKPLIAGTKKTSDIKISKYYNKKDFNLAKKAISEMKKARWSSALNLSK